MIDKDLDQAETIAVGFFIDPSNDAVQHPGHIARGTGGKLYALLHKRTTGDESGGMTVVGEQNGATWLFSARKTQYLLAGVRARSVAGVTARTDLRGRYEFFTRQVLTASAVFQVSDGLTVYGHTPQQSPVLSDLRFDALAVGSSELGAWIGLELPKQHEYPPQRPARTHHPVCPSVVGALAIRNEGAGDPMGDRWDQKDIVEVVSKRMTLESIYEIGCVVHDFINLTMGWVVPATLTLYDTDGRPDRHKWRRFDLMAQGNRFRPREPTGWGPMLDLIETGGLPALARLISWCEEDSVNRTVLARIANQKDNWSEAFIENWFTLNMLFQKKPESARFAELVHAVGKPIAMLVCPDGVTLESWQTAIADHRSKRVIHPTGSEADDMRRMQEGPVFALQMEFLLKAFVLKHGIGVNLANPKVTDGLKLVVNESAHWDWRTKGESYLLY